jgi:hypothetical protein
MQGFFLKWQNFTKDYREIHKFALFLGLLSTPNMPPNSTKMVPFMTTESLQFWSALEASFPEENNNTKRNYGT